MQLPSLMSMKGTQRLATASYPPKFQNHRMIGLIAACIVDVLLHVLQVQTLVVSTSYQRLQRIVTTTVHDEGIRC